VWLVVAGVREPPDPGGRFGANWLHLGVWFGGRWWRYRQNKHHRWSLDDNQIEQYHLAAALPPGVRWWEAMAVPTRAVQVVELAEGVTLVSLVCEDLARLDEVADLLRAIGPTLVVTTLLDGGSDDPPQRGRPPPGRQHCQRQRRKPPPGPRPRPRGPHRCGDARRHR
jgi:hypothetical protein